MSITKGRVLNKAWTLAHVIAEVVKITTGTTGCSKVTQSSSRYTCSLQVGLEGKAPLHVKPRDLDSALTLFSVSVALDTLDLSLLSQNFPLLASVMLRFLFTLPTFCLLLPWLYLFGLASKCRCSQGPVFKPFCPL